MTARTCLVLSTCSAALLGVVGGCSGIKLPAGMRGVDVSNGRPGLLVLKQVHREMFTALVAPKSELNDRWAMIVKPGPGSRRLGLLSDQIARESGDSQTPMAEHTHCPVADIGQDDLMTGPNVDLVCEAFEPHGEIDTLWQAVVADRGQCSHVASLAVGAVHGRDRLFMWTVYEIRPVDLMVGPRMALSAGRGEERDLTSHPP